MIVWPGLRRSVSAIQRLFNSASFSAPLTHSLVLERGTGSPTFTRATTATVTDNEGVLRTAIAGEARFEGARRVYNECPTSSASIAVAANKTITATVGVYIFSMGAGTGTITFTGTATGSTGTLNASASARTSKVLTITVAGTIIATASVATCVDIQFENITGRADQTTPSEYVSVGVESAPYHGAGVDGVKYFDTDLDGNPIAASTNTGYVAEGARTNRALHSQDFSNAVWVSGGGGIAVATNTVVAPDGTTTADTLTASGANGTLIQDLGVVASAAKAGGLWLKRKTGTGNVDLTLDGGATWTTVFPDSTQWLRFEKTQTLADEDFGVRLVTSGDAVYAWQGQVETAAFLSSDIPTTTAAVTRPSDSLSYSSTGNVGTDNTLYCETLASNANPNSGFLVELHKDNSNRLQTSITSAGLVNAGGLGSGALQASVSIAGSILGTMTKVAGVLATNNVNVARSGLVGTADTSATMPTYTNIYIGTYASNAGYELYGNIRNVRIFFRALSDSELQAITR